jgi:fibronectin-binding autotransporter adhesin
MKRLALKRWIPIRLAALVAPLIAAWPQMAQAAPLTWDGNGNTAPNPDGGTGIWDVNTSLNWWDGLNNVVWPAPGGTDDDAIFGNTEGTVSLAAGGVTANDLTFNTTGYLLQNNILTLNGLTPTVTTGTGITATISSQISGASGLVKAGDGLLILTGANNYTGNTTVGAGTLQLGNGTVNGTVTGGLYNLAAGTTLYLNNATATPAPTAGWASRVRGSGTLRLNTAQAVNGSGNWGPNAAAALPFDPGFTGTLQVDRGRMDSSPAGLGGITNMVFNSGSQFLAWTGTYNQPFSLAGDGWGEAGQPGALRVASGSNATFNGPITLTDHAGFNSQDGNAVMTINGAISGAGFNITKHNGGLLTLTGANTYTGTTTVNAGILHFANTQSFYNGNTGSWNDANLIVNSGGTAAFSVGGAGEFTLADIDAFRALSTATGGFKSGSSIGIDTTNAGGSLTYASDIANPGGNVLGFAKLGTGTLVLTGNNTYTGPTHIRAGTLEIATANSLGGGGAYAGAISGAGNLVKSSPGTLVLTGANTLSGLTTISNGSIELGDGTIQASPSGNYNIQSGTTLKVRYNTTTGAVAQTWTRYTGGGTLTLATGKNFDTGWGTANLPYAFTGTVRVEGGRVQTAAANAFQNMGFGGTQNVIVTQGGHVGMWEGGLFNSNFTISGTGYGETGYESALRFGNGGATTTLAGVVTMGGNTTLGAGGGIGIISRGLGENTVSNLTVGTSSQGGTVILRGASTYTGTTTVNNSATLELGGAGTLGGGNYTQALNISAATSTFRYASSANQTLSGVVGGLGTLVANGPGTLTLSGSNTHTGAVTVGGGTLALDYAANNDSKIGDGAVLNLNGGTLTLAGTAGNNHIEVVGSTSLNGGVTLNRSGENTAQLALGAINRGAGGALEVAATGLATTTTGNTNGVLPGVTLAGGLAMNDGANNIVAYSGAYADVNRLGGSIGNVATDHVRIIEGGASGDITLGGAGTNTISTLSNNSTGGLATVDVGTGRVLRLGAAGSILSPSTSTGLTISGAGTLTAGGADNTAGGLLVLNQSSSPTTLSTVIANNGTGAVTLTKSGSGALSVTGVNTFTGGVNVNQGTLTARVNVGQNALGTGAVAVSGGSTLVLNNVSTATGPVNISNVFSGAGNIQLLFADGTTSPRNTNFNTANTLANFNGTFRLSLAPGATATGDKFTSGTTVVSPASLVIDPGTQFFVSGVTAFNGGITVSGIGNSESRGAIRLANTLGGNLTLAGDTAIGTEGGTILGNIASGAAGTQTLTFGTGSSTGNGFVNGIIGGGVGDIALVKNQGGTLTLRASNTYSGGTTVNGGILSVGSGGTASQTASPTALGTGGVTVNNGATLRLWIKNDAAYTVANNITVNGGTIHNEDGNHTLAGTVFADSLGATLSTRYNGKNFTLGNVISGPGDIRVAAVTDATSRVILTAANSYTGATTVNSGTLTLSGAGGSILSSSGLTVRGGTFLLDNTPTANVGNRIADAMPVTMHGATFNFAHTAGAANYAETAGALTLNPGAATIAASQAASGQTSALTFASLTRNAGGSVNFSGTGLGADTRNRILFTASPLVDGIIGPWASVNGNLATYDAALGVREFTAFTELVRLTGSKVIADAPGSHIRIVEGTGTAADLTLSSAVTNVSTITQSTTGGASAATIDLNGQTLRLGVNGGVTALAGSGAVNVGLVANPGILTAGGTDNTAGRISFINLSGNATVVNSAITNNGTGVVSAESLAGNLTFAGGTANTFNGSFDISTLGSANTRSITFAKPDGVTAIGDNAVVNFGLGTTGESNLRMAASGQFGNNVLMNFQNPNGAWARFDLMGTNQSLAGITTPTLSATQHGAVIQNRELSGSANRGTSTLTLTGSGNYQYNGYIRDADSGVSATNQLALVKSGSGTQTLAGSQIIYTGATTVSNGVLRLTDTTGFTSSITNAATVEFNSTAVTTVAAAPRTGGALAGAGTFNKTGPGIFRINGALPVTATGQFNIQQGTLQNDGNAVNWSGNTADVDISSGAILDLYADPISLDALTGSGFVQNNYGNAAGSQSGSSAFYEKLTIGTNNGNGTFSGIIRNNSTGTVPAAATAGGGVELEKTGLGVQTLSGINTYTGPTLVSAGELRVNGSIVTSSLTTVSSGAILSGSGSIGAITFAAGSSLRPGNSPGILNTGSASSSADVYIEIGGPTAGNGSGFHDQINTTGSLTLDGGLLSITLVDSYVPNRNDTFDIWLNDDTDSILGAGTFTGLAEGAQIFIPETSGGQLDNDYWLISYAGSTGNDITLTYVPEPSSTLLAGATILFALGRRRRR